MGACLDDDDVLQLVCGTLDAPAQRHAQDHLDTCVACRQLVASAAPDSEPAAVGEWEQLEIGSQLGRYQITDVLGAGAMGFVFAATDPELGRTVALKLLRASGTAERLRREAQALARLSHPNVVTVHDVGSFGDHLFVALEWVDGGTLAQWLDEPRTVTEIVAAFRQAGEGLAAAHAAGLVHRDVKPDNLLVGKDGRVRVTDFGLALAIEDSAAPEELSGTPDATPAIALSSALRLTATGAVVGTPAYVSPEQLEGHAADVRSDQFSFCVALFEALHGYKPFAGEDWPALRASVRAGVITHRAGGRRVPRWLGRIVAQGLASDPKRRWPTMRALLDALDRGPLVTPGRAAVGVFVIAGAAVALVTQRHHDSPCDHLGDPWAAVWSDTSAAALHARLGTHAEVSTTVDHAFRTYGTAWSKMTLDSCVASDRGTQTRDVAAVRDRCLGERREYALELAQALLTGPPPRIDGALEVASGLPSIDECANTQALMIVAPETPTPSMTVRRAALQIRMAQVTIDGYLSASIDPLRFQVLANEAHALGLPGLEARALLLRARYETDEQAEEVALQGSALAAFAARDDAALADAWQRLAFHTGFHAARYRESEQWAAYARGAIARLGGDPVREAELLMSRGFALIFEGKNDEARRAMIHARELFVAARGPDYWRIAVALYGEGGALLALGKPAEALALYEQSRALAKRLGGTTSVNYVTASDNVGNALVALGRIDEGIALFDELDRAGDSSSWRQEQVSAALRSAGRFTEALGRDARAAQLVLAEKAEGPRALYPSFGTGLDLLGLHRASEALPLLEHVLAAREHGVPDELAQAQFAVAQALRATGGDARRAHELAVHARALLAPLGAAGEDTVREIDAWLARNS